MKSWVDEEVINLFKLVEEAKLKGKRSDGFKNYAKISGRHANSVRNYYYQEVKSLSKDEKRAKSLGIDMALHITNETKEFTRNEEYELKRKIKELLNKGYSVRKACLELAGGDVKEMLRLQNKYRQLKNSGTDNNIITMPERKKTVGLSDKEINSLFMGLVRLVKKSAMEEVSRELKSETTFAGTSLRKALVNLSNKEKEYKKLQEKFKIIENENKKLVKQVEDLKCFKAEIISENLKRFKDFTKNHKSQAVIETE